MEFKFIFPALNKLRLLIFVLFLVVPCLASSFPKIPEHSLVFRNGRHFLPDYSSDLLNHVAEGQKDAGDNYVFSTFKGDYICFDIIKIPSKYNTKFKATVYLNELISAKKLPSGLNLESQGEVEYRAVGKGGPDHRFTRCSISGAPVNDDIYFTLVQNGALLIRLTSNDLNKRLYFKYMPILYSILGFALFHDIKP